MLINVTTEEGTVYPLHVNDELQLCDLKALLDGEIGISVKEMMLIHNMSPLSNDSMMLKDCGIQEGDVILAVKVKEAVPSIPPTVTSPNNHPQAGGSGLELSSIDWSSVQVPASRPSSGVARSVQQNPSTSSANSVESIFQHFLSNPEELASLQQRNPELAEAIMSGDYNWTMQALSQYRQRIMQEEAQRAQLSSLDPWSEEYQQKVAENIRQRNIQENMEKAMEYNPEIFAGHVHMLYISCKVNGQTVKALVDSGAQMTVMNVQCAQRCDIMRLVDRRYASYAFGIGRQRILGVIHLGQIQIGDDFLASSFRILEDQSHELIVGLDMLKRHQCCIDLSRDVLRVGTTGKETKFLSESEVPQATYKQEEKNILEDEDQQMASAIAKSEAEYKEKNNKPPETSSGQTMPLELPPTVSEESVQSVMAAGFKRDAAIQELVKCNGDPDVAKANLFARLFKL